MPTSEAMHDVMSEIHEELKRSHDVIDLTAADEDMQLEAANDIPAEADAEPDVPYQHQPPIICHSCGLVGHIRMDPVCRNHQSDRVDRKIIPRIEDVAVAVDRLKDEVRRLAEMQNDLWRLMLNFVRDYYDDHRPHRATR